MKATSHLSTTETPADVLGFFEAVKLAGLEFVPMTVSAAVQRKHFGKVIFGKKCVTVNDMGQVHMVYSTGYDKGAYDEEFYGCNAFLNRIEQIPYVYGSKFSKPVAA
jgi:hypothetical protein